jgi:protein-L-isoaspartate(D-aspartate) O-methyltransferase
MQTQTNELEFEKVRLINLLASYGIREPILSAFDQVPRHFFVDRNLWQAAYEDHALLIDEGQTISQPSLVAEMLQALQLRGDEKVLEIGTGSGFGAALLGKLVKTVYTIELLPSLAKKAKTRIASLGIKNVEVVVGDGTEGLEKNAPYDVIIVTAYTSRVPPSLMKQLSDDGKLIIPIGEKDWQEVILYKKISGKLDAGQKIAPVRFVPLIGKYA